MAVPIDIVEVAEEQPTMIERPLSIDDWGRLPNWSGAGFMNRRRLCQLTAAILTSDLTTHMWVL